MRKQILWLVPLGVSVVWSRVNQAWLALFGHGPIETRSVLKGPCDTDAMHDWIREHYGAGFGCR